MSITRLNAALSDRYRIERELGEGGMATVYLAQDLKHDRKVALKVLKPELAAVLGADRFLAEITTTANLQHPNILPLFDSGEADGFLFYVMPYVEGETLRDRLDREKQLPVDESVQIASDVAEALQSAHEQGVIHRDIKPANILLSRGRPLVADFGIALAVSSAGGGRLTETGLSLGTPHYMSPEQATGDQAVGPSADIYALGCVLYEMLVGEPPHGGATVQAVLASVLTESVRDLRELRDTVPDHVAWAANKALARLPADRFPTAEALAAAVAGKTAIPGHPPKTDATALRSSGVWTAAPWVVAAAAVTALSVSVWPDAAPVPRSWNIALPDSAPLVFVGEASLAVGLPAVTISPDGSTIVYVGRAGTTTQLYRRRTDGFDVVPLAGTEGAYAPFFSPDGARIGFFSSDQLKITSPEGGSVSVVADVPDGHVGTWSEDDRIAVTVRNGSEVLIVSPSGLEQRTLRVPDLGTRTPQWLPNSDWIVRDCLNLNLCVTSVQDGETLFLTADGPAVSSPRGGGTLLFGAHPQITANGFLVYSGPGENSTLAIRFDPESFVTSGQPFEVIRGLRREAAPPIQHVAISQDGTLVYAEGADASIAELVWVDGSGGEETLPYPPQVYGPFAVSPSGERIAVSVTTDAGPRRLLLLDLTRGNSRPWSGPSDDNVSHATAWDASSRYVYVSSVGDPMRVIRIDAEATVGGEILYEGQRPLVVEGQMADGQLIVDEYGGGLYLVPESTLRSWSQVDDSTGVVPIEGAFFGAVSPDGRWLSYTAAISGRFEAYAVSLPLENVLRPHMISTDGGEAGVWSPAGDGLYYRDASRWYFVPLTGNPDQPFGEPELFFEGSYLNLGGLEHAVSPDGTRLLVVRGVGSPTTTTLNVVTNWFEVLEGMVPG